MTLSCSVAGLFSHLNRPKEMSMIAQILRSNRLTMTAWDNMVVECRQKFITSYLRQLGK